MAAGSTATATCASVGSTVSAAAQGGCFSYGCRCYRTCAAAI